MISGRSGGLNGACERGRLPPLCGEDIANLFGFEMVEVDLDVLSERGPESVEVGGGVDSVRDRPALRGALELSGGRRDDDPVSCAVRGTTAGQRDSPASTAPPMLKTKLAPVCRILLLEQQDGAGRADRERAHQLLGGSTWGCAPSGFARWPAAVEMGASYGPSIRRPGKCRSELRPRDKDGIQTIVAAQGERLRDLRLVSEELGRPPPTDGAAFTTPGPAGTVLRLTVELSRPAEPSDRARAPHPNPRTLDASLNDIHLLHPPRRARVGCGPILHLP